MYNVVYDVVCCGGVGGMIDFILFGGLGVWVTEKQINEQTFVFLELLSELKTWRFFTVKYGRFEMLTSLHNHTKHQSH